MTGACYPRWHAPFVASGLALSMARFDQSTANLHKVNEAFLIHSIVEQGNGAEDSAMFCRIRRVLYHQHAAGALGDEPPPCKLITLLDPEDTGMQLTSDGSGTSRPVTEVWLKNGHHYAAFQHRVSAAVLAGSEKPRLARQAAMAAAQPLVYNDKVVLSGLKKVDLNGACGRITSQTTNARVRWEVCTTAAAACCQPFVLFCAP